MSEWTIKRLREYLGLDCHTSDHVLDVLAQEINAALAAEREKPDQSERDWSEHLRIQLAAEVEKVNAEQKRAGELWCDLQDTKQQLAAERETYSRDMEEAHCVISAKNEELEHMVVAHEQQLAAEREKVQELQDELGIARETYQSARRSSDMGWQRAENYKQQLAGEREKYERSQEKVREYFDLLAAERAKPKTTQYAQGWDDHVLAARSQIEDLKEQLAAERKKVKEAEHRNPK